MVLIFDLDDTLYDERTYVESGLRSVARLGQERFGWNPEASFAFMVEVLDREGRGAIFDHWLASHGGLSRMLVKQCVRRYRHHEPDIVLDERAEKLLREFAGYPLYIVTDGHKIAQAKKIEALGVAKLVRKVFITHRHGIAHAKPSLYCFERIRSREGCEWADMIYVGDNPAKDFVSLNEVGANTVRVLTGMHAKADAAPGYEARFRIDNLDALPDLLSRLSLPPPRLRLALPENPSETGMS